MYLSLSVVLLAEIRMQDVILKARYKTELKRCGLTTKQRKKNLKFSPVQCKKFSPNSFNKFWTGLQLCPLLAYSYVGFIHH